MSRPVVARDPKTRRSEIAIAVLFVVTAAAAIAGGAFSETLFEDPTDLARIGAGRADIAAGAALWTVNNLGFVFIALFAWPVLHPVAPAMANAYVATRIIESAVMMIGVMALVTVALVAATPGTETQIGVLAALAATSLDTGMLPLLGFSGLFFTAALLAHRLLPAALAGFGLAAYVLVMTAGFLAWFGLAGIGPGDRGFVLVVPVALWEIVLMPVWLLWRGFARPS